MSTPAHAAGAPAPGGPASVGATPPPPPDVAERMTAQIQALKRALVAERLQPDEIALALPGDLLTFRILDLPFSDARRIESVLGYELESQLMGSIDELVIDHVVVASRAGETRVLVAAAPRAAVEAVVVQAAAEQLPVRILGAAPLAYAALLGAAASQQAAADAATRSVAAATAEAPAEPAGPTLVVDVGHASTTVCVVRGGVPELARTIPRGGRHFTDAIAAALRLDLARAEAAKHDAGFVGHSAMVAETPSQQRMDGCLREAARPLARELRQTVAAYRASYGSAIARAVFVGGGARLVGLPEHLAEELAVPLAPLPWPELERAPGAAAAEGPHDQLAVAVGMALAAVGASASVNFRKGEFAYRSDYSFLREKAAYFGVAALLVLCFAVLNAVASLRGLRQERDQLAARLKRETTELFGEPRTDARAISDELKAGAKGQSGPPVPTITAFDVLDEISRHVPASDKARIDILDLDIRPKKTLIKGTADTAQQVDDLADALARIDCFEEPQKGKLSTVSGPPVVRDKDKDGKDGDKPERTELKQFTLTINTTCP